MPESDEAVVIKASRRTLVHNSLGFHKGDTYRVKENIFKERAILKFLTHADDAPKGIVKYIGWFHDERNYYLVEEHGGCCLFDFVCTVHDHIKEGRLAIAEWHKAAQVLFKQMVDTLDYIHARDVAVYDVSIENMLINECSIQVDELEDGRFSFVLDDIELKFCDFGLAEHFDDDKSGEADREDGGEGAVSFVWSKNAGKPNYKSPEMHELRAGKRKAVDARKNDVHCLGVCLFMLLVGGMPFKRATPQDTDWLRMSKGQMGAVLEGWGRDHYVTREMTALMTSMLKREADRISISDLKQHPWLNRAL